MKAKPDMYCSSAPAGETVKGGGVNFKINGAVPYTKLEYYKSFFKHMIPVVSHLLYLHATYVYDPCCLLYLPILHVTVYDPCFLLYLPILHAI